MKLNVFVSSVKDGIMSNDKKFFPNLKKEEINILYETTLSRFFKKRNIKYEDVVVLKEENSIIKSRVITRSPFGGGKDRPVEPPVMKTVTVDTFGVEYPEPEKNNNIQSNKPIFYICQAI